MFNTSTIVTYRDPQGEVCGRAKASTMAEIHGAPWHQFITAMESDGCYQLPNGYQLRAEPAVQVEVITARLPDALKALEKLAKKARRYGCDDITVTVGDTYEVEERIYERKPKVKFNRTTVVVGGAAPRVGDHEFLARVELTGAGCVLMTAPGVEDLDPRFRTTDGHCDHCHTARQRKDVFVVRDRATGRQLQIGRTCLRDYLGVDDPKWIIHKFDFWRTIQAGLGDDDCPWGSGGWSFRQYAPQVLAYTAAVMRTYGWCSRGQAQYSDATATADWVDLMLSREAGLDERTKRTRRELLDKVSDADEQLADETLAWLRADWEADNDYLHNLRVILSEDLVTSPRHMGLVVSAVQAYQRHMEREVRLAEQRRTAEEAAAKSSHLGSEKERLRGLELTVTACRVVGSSLYGDTVLIKFADASGNVVTWFTGSGHGLEIGQQVVLDGTVKRHTEFQGCAETQLTRCRVR